MSLLRRLWRWLDWPYVPQGHVSSYPIRIKLIGGPSDGRSVKVSTWSHGDKLYVPVMRPASVTLFTDEVTSHTPVHTKAVYVINRYERKGYYCGTL